MGRHVPDALDLLYVLLFFGGGGTQFRSWWVLGDKSWV